MDILNDSGLSTGALIALVVVSFGQTLLAAFCLIDIFRRPAVLGGRKWVWAVLVILFAIPGSIIYLAVGRVPAPVPLPEEGDDAVRPRADAATVLYAPAEQGPAPARPAIVIAGLTKQYETATALAGVDLQVPEGSVFGFLGPNGAGKTTTLRILAGLARPTAGEARVFGHDTTTEADAVHALIGFLPDVPGFYKWMTAREYLELSAALFGIPAAERDERIETLLDLAGLSGVTTRIGGYSRGMKQRLGVAQALINSPRLLLLDEPTSALDPIGRREVLEMIAALAGRTTVFFSTHILADVERVCDQVAVLAAGRIVEQAPIGKLRSRHGGAQRVIIETSDPQRLGAALSAEAWTGAVRRDGSDLIVEVSDLEVAYREVPALVARLGLPLRRFDADEVSLEDVFVDLVQGASA
ncbi:MAG: ATP-binding cassette domain-containing protein [Actinobacteria bacterium]|nr:ATP-binding cassette domain-containing protein [Actinomycetota bacterium]